jgi:septum formation protein
LNHVKKLAFEKAKSLTALYSDAIIIGSDTLVELEGKVLPKPKTKEEAINMLTSLSGTIHRIHTGFALIDAQTSKKDLGVQTSLITFRNITTEEAAHYVEREDVLGVAGAYDHEHLGGIFIENLNGEFYGSIGLPLFAIAKSLKEHFGIDVLTI